jgi:uncharacterized protein with FMN-binding domain
VRRIVLWLASTVTVVVLLFGYHTSTNKTAPAATAGNDPSASVSTSGSSTGSGSSSDGASTSGGSGSGSSAAKTYTGAVVQTRWGPVQVQIAVEDGKVTAATVLQQPDGNPRDTEINDYALPILIKDTIEQQSADIDMVSGATVTSDGYVQSLQAALDEAGI